MKKKSASLCLVSICLLLGSCAKLSSVIPSSETPSSSLPPSSVASSTSSSTNTSSSSSSSTSSSSVPIVTGNDYTGAPKTFTDQHLTGEQLAVFYNEGMSDVPWDDISPDGKTMIRSMAAEAGLTANQVILISSLIADVNYMTNLETKAGLEKMAKRIRSDLSVALAAVDADQIAYVIPTILDSMYADYRQETPLAITSLSLLNSITAILPEDSRAAFAKQSEFFTASWNEKGATLSLNSLVVLCRFVKALFVKITAEFTDDEFTSLLTAMVLSRDSEDSPEGIKLNKPIQAILSDLTENSYLYINKLAVILKEVEPNAASHVALGASVSDVIIYFLKTAMYANGNYTKELEAQRLAIGDKIAVLLENAGSFQALYRFVMAVGANITKADIQAARNLKTVNPITQFIGTYDKAFASLSTTDQTAFTAIFTTLGLNLTEVRSTLLSYKDIDVTDKTAVEPLSQYMTSLLTTLQANFAMTLPYVSAECRLRDGNDWFAPGYTLTSDDISLRIYTSSDDMSATPTSYPVLSSEAGVHEVEIPATFSYVDDKTGETKTGTATFVGTYAITNVAIFVDYGYVSKNDNTPEEDSLTPKFAGDDKGTLLVPMTLTNEKQGDYSFCLSAESLTDAVSFGATPVLVTAANGGSGLDVSTTGLKYGYVPYSYTTENGTPANDIFGFAYYVFDPSDTSLATPYFSRNAIIVQNADNAVIRGRKGLDFSNVDGGTFAYDQDMRFLLPSEKTTVLGFQKATLNGSDDPTITAAMSYYVADPDLCTISKWQSTIQFQGETDYGFLSNTRTFAVGTTPTVTGFKPSFAFGDNSNVGGFTVASSAITDLTVDTTTVTDQTGARQGSFIWDGHVVCFSYNVATV